MQVPIDAKRVFVPKGFDSNDNTQIVLHGDLPNLCYKSSLAGFKISDKTIFVNLWAFKDILAGTQLCTPMSVPVTEVVNLGILPAGDYQIVVNEGTMFEKKSAIRVEEAPTQSTDDFIYANVESVDRIPESRNVILRGYNPSDCYVLDQNQWISNGVDTFAILPIMKKVKNVCPRKMVPFEINLSVPEDLDASGDEVLLHVRVMNGKSVNHVFHKKFE